MSSMADLFWLLFIIAALIPVFQKRALEAARMKMLHRLEQKRKSRVIAMIHRQETMAFLGFPLVKYIDIHDSEQVLRAIRLTPKDMPIDLILHTPGGLVLAAEQIANAIYKHPAKVTVMVPHYAMSGGTLLALAADEIIMDESAVLGPVDPQLGDKPAASILKILNEKKYDDIDDETLILADVSEKAIKQIRTFVQSILSKNMDEKKSKKLATILTEGRWTHDYPITVDEARELGLNVSTELPEEVYKLMDLYPQPGQQKASVQYIPIPYRRPGNSHEANHA